MVGRHITVSTKVKLFGMTIPLLGLSFEYDVLCESSATIMNYERFSEVNMYFKNVLGERVYSLSGGCSFPLLFPLFPQIDRYVTDAWSAQNRLAWTVLLCLQYQYVMSIVIVRLCNHLSSCKIL